MLYKGLVCILTVMSYVALLCPRAAGDGLCTVQGGGAITTSCSDNGCAKAGGTCALSADGLDCDCTVPPPPPPPPKSTSSGGGKTDPLGPPPSPFHFSLGMFEPGTFTYAKDIQFTPTTTIALSLTNLHGTIEFTPTVNPDILIAQFTQFEFDYVPFDFPGTPFTGINREVLNPA